MAFSSPSWDRGSIPSGDPVPDPEPDAYRAQIPDQPDPTETGAQAFGRDVAQQLALRLPPPLTDLTYRENPWDHRPCPQAQFYDITIGGHHIRITAYQVHDPHARDTRTAFAITLDQQPVPFDRAPIDPLPQQMAYAIWNAHLDQPEHPHPYRPTEPRNPASVPPIPDPRTPR